MGKRLFDNWCAFIREKGPDGQRLHLNLKNEAEREMIELEGRRETENALEEDRTDEHVEEGIKFFARARREHVVQWFDSLVTMFVGFREWRSSNPKSGEFVDAWIDYCILGRGINMRSLAAFRGHLAQLVTEPHFKWQDLNCHIMRLCPPSDVFASACRGEQSMEVAFLSRCFPGIIKK